MMGLGMTAVLSVLGLVREFLGQGTLLGGIEMIVEGAEAIQVLPTEYPGFLVAILPPGAFFVLGLMIAGKNWLDERANERARARLLAHATS